MYNMSDIYKEYYKEHNRVDKETFSDICAEFNIMVMDKLLEGKEFNMGNHLSTLSIVRRDRDPRSPNNR